MSKSANFFFHTFGWKEMDYEDVCTRLQEDSVCVPTTVDITIPQFEAYTETDVGSGRTATILKESCSIKRRGKGETGVVGCGTFSTPSVEELRGEVHRLLTRDDVKAVLAPYRAAAKDRVAGMMERRASTGSGDGTAAAPKKKAPKERFVHVSHIVGDSRALHTQERYSRAMFQAASQFNYLEFPSPGNIPENGITAYVYDRTQGPACAIACAAGTAYRNYLAPLNADAEMNLSKMVRRGQTRDLQMNGLADVERLLCSSHKGESNPLRLFFDVKNGYVDSTKPRLEALNNQLKTGGLPLVDACISKLRIAVQQDVEVTDALPSVGSEPPVTPRLVSQTYNSALSVGYSRCTMGWTDFATIVLSGSYEATMLAGIINTVSVLLEEERGRVEVPKRPAHPLFTGLRAPPPILLTKVGGGVFGNRSAWISTAMQRAFVLASTYQVPLNVLITHFGSVEPDYNHFNNKPY